MGTGEILRAGNLFFRFAVTDYMCLIQDAFPGIFFWIAIQALLFYFERKLHFSQKKEDCLKKTALSDYFLRILIDKLGPYMCYVIFHISINN